MNLHDKVFIITGGKRIGRIVGRELAAAGANLVLSYRGSKEEATLTAADAETLGRRATTFAADVSQPADCAALIGHAIATLGRVDGLINMASIYKPHAFEELTSDEWDADIDINLRSAFLCAHAAVPHMRKSGGGRIINFADWLARSGRPRYRGFVSYYVAKAGIVALTEALALELSKDQILVNAIAPGPIVPPPEITQAEIDEVAAVTPLGRWGGEMEIAKAVLMLCASDFITGETIRVDGGRHLE